MSLDHKHTAILNQHMSLHHQDGAFELVRTCARGHNVILEITINVCMECCDEQLYTYLDNSLP